LAPHQTTPCGSPALANDPQNLYLVVSGSFPDRFSPQYRQSDADPWRVVPCGLRSHPQQGSSRERPTNSAREAASRCKAFLVPERAVGIDMFFDSSEPIGLAARNRRLSAGPSARSPALLVDRAAGGGRPRPAILAPNARRRTKPRMSSHPSEPVLNIDKHKAQRKAGTMPALHRVHLIVQGRRAPLMAKPRRERQWWPPYRARHRRTSLSTWRTSIPQFSSASSRAAPLPGARSRRRLRRM